jgi:hypothetical protein
MYSSMAMSMVILRIQPEDLFSARAKLQELQEANSIIQFPPSKYGGEF